MSTTVVNEAVKAVEVGGQGAGMPNGQKGQAVMGMAVAAVQAGSAVQTVQSQGLQAVQVRGKKPYSEYVYGLTAVAKDNGLSLEDARDELVKMAHLHPHDQYKVAYGLVANLEYRALVGECVHYFVTGEGMAKWLTDVAPSLDENYFALLKTTTEQVSKDGESGTIKTIMLHFEGGGAPCWLVRIQDGGLAYSGMNRPLNPGLNRPPIPGLNRPGNPEYIGH